MTLLFRYSLALSTIDYSLPRLTIYTDRVETNKWSTQNIIVDKHLIVEYNNYVVCYYGTNNNTTHKRISVYSKKHNTICTFSVVSRLSIIAYNTDLYIVINNIPTYLVYGQGYFDITNKDILYDQAFESPLACIIKYRLAIYNPKKVDYGRYIYPQKMSPHIALPLFRSALSFRDIVIQ